ncbi:MAG: type I CRISPR-associated protein Cas7 [Methanobrevibacter ruminantium]|uniref:type I CRISPR-associated protein Cas7 n=1 Tax=Methanobrevibacter ruminantium TaxID=83816 RepID=UPI0026ECAE8F|nr:type I CRISPR-associated protein Cas7 [Methanobrevibacter ruminantium]MDD6047831.1 type I CRISPR-associated protein Cas7 [Methanobrevibacter ruminantium]
MTGENNSVKNFYQGIYVTETILGNPNGDFIDNSPRNFDGNVFTTDKCIKYNVRKYIHETIEDLDAKENIVFFFPRLVEDANAEDNKFKTRDDVFDLLFKDYDSFEEKFDALKDNSPDVRMFGGTFSFKNNDPKQIYGPIQLSYGVDINDAQIKRLQIGAPFARESGKQKTNGSEAVVDDAIITYDITINPKNHPNLLLESDLDLFKKALWYGTNARKSTSKKTDSKLLILIKFAEEDTVLNIGELKELIEVSNIKEHKLGDEEIKLCCEKLFKKLNKYLNFIDSIEFVYDTDELTLEYDENEFSSLIDKFEIKGPSELL